MINEGIEIKDIEAYLINHKQNHIRMCSGYDYDDVKTGSEWLNEYRQGKVTEYFEYTAYEDDDADYYDIRIEVY